MVLTILPSDLGHFSDVGGALEEHVGEFGGCFQLGGHFKAHKIHRTRVVLF